MALTGRLNYQAMKPPAVKSRAYRTTVNAINGNTFTANSVIRFDIPVGRPNTYLDPTQTYLQFSVENKYTAGKQLNYSLGAAAVAPATSPYPPVDVGTLVDVDEVALIFEQDATSFIRRLDIFHGSSLLETIESYNLLVHCMSDLGMNHGTGRSGSSFQPRGPMSQALGGKVSQGGILCFQSVQQIRFGDCLSSTSGAHSDYSKGTYCLPFTCSGVLSGACQKYLPVGRMASGGNLRVELTLEDEGTPVQLFSQQPTGDYSTILPLTGVNDVGYWGESNPAYLPDDDGLVQGDANVETWPNSLYSGTGNWEISNPTIQLQYVELGDDAQRAIDSMTEGNYRINTRSFRNYSFTTTPFTANNLLVGAAFQSLNTLWATSRISSDIGNIQMPSLRNRLPITLPGDSGNTATYQWLVGSVQVPQIPIPIQNNAAAGQKNKECAIETQKALHALDAANPMGLTDPAGIFTGQALEGGGAGSTSSQMSGSVGHVRRNFARVGNLCPYLHGAFICGQELESFAHMSDVADAGINTLGTQVYLQTTNANVVSSDGVIRWDGKTQRVDVFADFSMVIEIVNGVAQARY